MVTQNPAPTPSAQGPVFSAITSSTRHIYQLLRCISFGQDAHVGISKENIRFSMEDGTAMQANVCLTPDLFSSYNYTPQAALQLDEHGMPPSSAERYNIEQDDEGVRFMISFSALLECLQIFGADSNKEKQFGSGFGAKEVPFARSAVTVSSNLFDQNSLRLPGTCRFVYEGEGHPFSIILEESGVSTTCHLTTFLTNAAYNLIPFDRASMTHKIIIKGAWLHDAFTELESSNPDILTYSASPSKPHFSLAANGILGHTTIDFINNNKNVMESFFANVDTSHKYKFSLIRKAMRAMGQAVKASLRGDAPGVLSMQYLMETPEKGAPTFIDFRFVPMSEDLDEDGDDDGGRSERESGEDVSGGDPSDGAGGVSDTDSMML